jgi:hypothetical protein
LVGKWIFLFNAPKGKIRIERKSHTFTAGRFRLTVSISPLPSSAVPPVYLLRLYWLAKEISRIVKEHNPEEAGVDISLLAHISPIAWRNVIIYGDYKLDKDLVK